MPIASASSTKNETQGSSASLAAAVKTFAGRIDSRKSPSPGTGPVLAGAFSAPDTPPGIGHQSSSAGTVSAAIAAPIR